MTILQTELPVQDEEDDVAEDISDMKTKLTTKKDNEVSEESNRELFL